MNALYVALGSAAGGVARWWLGGALQRRLAPAIGAPLAFPVGTLVVNVTGSFLLGALFVVLSRMGGRGDVMRLLLAIGFCGGYTTFSTFSMETVALVEGGAPWLAAFNVICSVVLSLLATFAGILLMRAMLGHPTS